MRLTPLLAISLTSSLGRLAKLPGLLFPWSDIVMVDGWCLVVNGIESELGDVCRVVVCVMVKARRWVARPRIYVFPTCCPERITIARLLLCNSIVTYDPMLFVIIDQLMGALKRGSWYICGNVLGWTEDHAPRIPYNVVGRRKVWWKWAGMVAFQTWLVSPSTAFGTRIREIYATVRDGVSKWWRCWTLSSAAKLPDWLHTVPQSPLS